MVAQPLLAIRDDAQHDHDLGDERQPDRPVQHERDSGGQKLADASQTQVEGATISYTTEGTLAAPALAVAGDFSMAVIGVRQDLTYKLLDQAVITDDEGAIVYNLPQQDMLALRVVARFAYAVAQPASRNAVGGYPFAVLTEAAP